MEPHGRVRSCTCSGCSAAMGTWVSIQGAPLEKGAIVSNLMGTFSSGCDDIR